MKTIRVLLLVALAWLAIPSSVVAFYNPEEGRWLSRDPIEDKAFASGMLEPTDASASVVDLTPQQRAKPELGLYTFVVNQPLDRVDWLGLFGDGHNGNAGANDFRGHGDFHGHHCFDYTAEDHDPATRPLPGGNPAGHFQDLGTSRNQVRNAILWCDARDFEHKMHRLQDYYTHWAKGFRWNPSAGQFGHAGAIPNPDNDNHAWRLAEVETRRWIREWNNACHCQPCW